MVCLEYVYYQQSARVMRMINHARMHMMMVLVCARASISTLISPQIDICRCKRLCKGERKCKRARERTRGGGGEGGVSRMIDLDICPIDMCRCRRRSEREPKLPRELGLNRSRRCCRKRQRRPNRRHDLSTRESARARARERERECVCVSGCVAGTTYL